MTDKYRKVPPKFYRTKQVSKIHLGGEVWREGVYFLDKMGNKYRKIFKTILRQLEKKIIQPLDKVPLFLLLHSQDLQP